MVDLLLKYCPS